MENQAHWYAVYTKPRSEKKLAGRHSCKLPPLLEKVSGE
jgi:hypothetical protein